MVTGAVNAGMTVVGGSLGNALRARYVASRGGEAALSWAQRAGAGLVEGAPDGFIGGFAGGFTDTALADGTFRDGLVAGFSRSLEGGLEGAALGAALGAGVGAGMGTARGVFGRGALESSRLPAGEADLPGSPRPEADGEFVPGLGLGSPIRTSAVWTPSRITVGDGRPLSHSVEQPWPVPAPTGKKPRIDEPGAAEWRYQRYLHEQSTNGKTLDDVLSKDEWIERYFKPTALGGRPGRSGGVEQMSAKRALREEGIRIVENVELGGRYPDGIRPTPNGFGGTDYFEVGRMLNNGLPEARERVKLVDELRALKADDTVTFVDRGNPMRRVTYRVEDLAKLLATLPRHD
jgi:hypothetical protein